MKKTFADQCFKRLKPKKKGISIKVAPNGSLAVDREEALKENWDAIQKMPRPSNPPVYVPDGDEIEYKIQSPGPSNQTLNFPEGYEVDTVRLSGKDAEKFIQHLESKPKSNKRLRKLMKDRTYSSIEQEKRVAILARAIRHLASLTDCELISQDTLTKAVAKYIEDNKPALHPSVGPEWVSKKSVKIAREDAIVFFSKLILDLPPI